MSRYAADTQVSADRSRAELERTLQRYGADAFSYGWDGPRAVVMFRASSRHVKFELVMPDPRSEEFALTPGKRRHRSEDAQRSAWEQATRQRWRALNLVVKAKLEAVESGITSFDEEFMAHLVLPDGGTVGEFMGPQIAQAYETGTMPEMLMSSRPQLARGAS